MVQLKRKFGDRYDGYRVKRVDPFFLLIPYLMKTRVDSQVYFSDEIDITELEKFIRFHNETDIPGLKLYHVVIAAMVRLYSQRPHLNRFVMRSKIYARNHISVSMAMKRSMSIESETTTVKPRFEPTDTLLQVVERFNSAVEANRTEIQENGTDSTAKVIGNLPSCLVRSVVNVLAFLDRRGLMPRIINKVSPFHTSLFLTNMGSIGIRPIYHHIYEFGTTSVFLALGKKETIQAVDTDGNLVRKRVVGIKVVADERICDGHYYASSMRMLAKYLKNPEELLEPPAQVVPDEGIDMKGRLPDGIESWEELFAGHLKEAPAES